MALSAGRGLSNHPFAYGLRFRRAFGQGLRPGLPETVLSARAAYGFHLFCDRRRGRMAVGFNRTDPVPDHLMAGHRYRPVPPGFFRIAPGFGDHGLYCPAGGCQYGGEFEPAADQGVDASLFELRRHLAHDQYGAGGNSHEYRSVQGGKMNTARYVEGKKGGSGKGMRIVIAGGGTGGHLFPGIAIAGAFRRKSAENRVLFVTTGRPIESRVLSRTDFETARIAAAGIKGKGIGGKLKALVQVPAGILGSLALFLRFRPHVVIGLGGYSAAPVIIAAWISGIFRVIHEQNRIAGMTNRFLARYAHRIYVSFPDTDMGGYPEKIRAAGTPIRPEIAAQITDRPRQSSPDAFTVLILGGSQGAHCINTSVIEALEHLDASRGYRFIHQTAAADMIICRAGATSVAEVSAAGLPAIFIPYPYAADNHQYFNAKSLVDAGAGEMIDQAALDGTTLAARIGYYAANEPVRRRMREKIFAFSRPHAAEEMAEDICRALDMRKMGKKSGTTALTIH